MNRLLPIVAALPALIFLALVTGTLDFGFLEQQEGHISPSKNKVAEINKSPSRTQGKLGVPTKFQEYTFFDLPNELNKAQIHDIVFHEGAMWLGTDKGLVKIVGQDVTVYRQFSDWPFEWVRDLAITPYGIVTSTFVANENTGGVAAKSHVFSIEDEIWHEIGHNPLSQAWHEGYLYQINSRLIRLDPSENWRETVVISSICGGRPSSLRMRSIGNELWTVGRGIKYVYTGTRRRSSESIGCGALRYIPLTGQSVVYDTTHGLNHNHGWDVDGDERGVYISHSTKNRKLSYFDLARDQWSKSSPSASGNRIAISPSRIWSARASPRRPLHSIDRSQMKGGRFFSTVSERTYFSAIGLNGKEVWLGAYEKSWSDSTYSITSRLGIITDE